MPVRNWRLLQGVKELSIEQLVPGDMLVDGRIQSHVVRFNEILTSVVIPPPKARLAGLVREAPASRSMGFRHGLAGDQSCSFATRPSTTRAWFLAASPAGHCAKRQWRAFLKGKTLSAELGEQAISVALANAAPLKYNATKIDMAKGLLASGLAQVERVDGCKPLRAFCSSPSGVLPSFLPRRFHEIAVRLFGRRGSAASPAAVPIGICST